MQTAIVNTTPAINAFLKTFTTAYQDGAGPATQTQVPPPPNHRCPKCTSLLEPDEIKDGYCWSCLNPLEVHSDTAMDD